MNKPITKQEIYTLHNSFPEGLIQILNEEIKTAYAKKLSFPIFLKYNNNTNLYTFPLKWVRTALKRFEEVGWNVSEFRDWKNEGIYWTLD